MASTVGRSEASDGDVTPQVALSEFPEEDVKLWPGEPPGAVLTFNQSISFLLAVRLEWNNQRLKIKDEVRPHTLRDEASGYYHVTNDDDEKEMIMLMMIILMLLLLMMMTMMMMTTVVVMFRRYSRSSTSGSSSAASFWSDGGSRPPPRSRRKRMRR
jgi:hypothetical protein